MEETTLTMTIGGVTLHVDGESGEVLGELCGCHACSNSRQPGHPYCSAPADYMLALEAAGKAWRSLDNSAWRWYIEQ